MSIEEWVTFSDDQVDWEDPPPDESGTEKDAEYGTKD